MSKLHSALAVVAAAALMSTVALADEAAPAATTENTVAETPAQ